MVCSLAQPLRCVCTTALRRICSVVVCIHGIYVLAVLVLWSQLDNVKTKQVHTHTKRAKTCWRGAVLHTKRTMPAARVLESGLLFSAGECRRCCRVAGSRPPSLLYVFLGLSVCFRLSRLNPSIAFRLWCRLVRHPLLLAGGRADG